MVSEQFDRCHGTLLQYVEFLSSAVTPAAGYAQLVPTLDELVRLYHLDPEVIYFLLAKSFKFPACFMLLLRCSSESIHNFPFFSNLKCTDFIILTSLMLSSGCIFNLSSSYEALSFSEQSRCLLAIRL